MQISELMTKDPLLVRVGTSLPEAIAVLAFAEVRHLPVVDEVGALVGMLSERDALAVFSLDDTSPEADSARAQAFNVEDVMSKEVFALGSDGDVKALCDVFIDQKMGAVPIVDAGELVGIASYVDVLRAVRGLL